MHPNWLPTQVWVFGEYEELQPDIMLRRCPPPRRFGHSGYREAKLTQRTRGPPYALKVRPLVVGLLAWQLGSGASSVARAICSAWKCCPTFQPAPAMGEACTKVMQNSEASSALPAKFALSR